MFSLDVIRTGDPDLCSREMCTVCVQAVEGGAFEGDGTETLCLASLQGLHRCLCSFPETLSLLLQAAGMASVELEDPQDSPSICFCCLHLLPIFFLGLLFWEFSPRQGLLQDTCPGVCIFTLSSGLQPGEELAEPSWLSVPDSTWFGPCHCLPNSAQCPHAALIFLGSYLSDVRFPSMCYEYV